MVKSANDDSYEMRCAGSFDAQSKSVTAAGTFTHKSSDGTVLEAGVWVVGELVSFDSYGIAPGELMSGGPAFGPQSSAQSVCQYSRLHAKHARPRVFRIPLSPMLVSIEDRSAAGGTAPAGKAPAERQIGVFDSFWKGMAPNSLWR